MDKRRADFNRFVADSADTLLRTAYLIVWDLGEAEDLVQETLFEVARRWPRVRRMERPVAYARRVLVNRALGGASRRAQRRQELMASPADEPADEASAHGAIDERDELVAALAQLPPRMRTVLVLRYFLDLPEAEVAAAMKCSLGTVKSTAFRGLARLEQALRPTNDPRSIPT
jgi:RNA polymerase sigma-70 factor (sigma-E family)